MKKDRRSSGLMRVPFVQRSTLAFEDGRSLSGFIVNINVLGAYVSADEGSYPTLGERVTCRFRIPGNERELAILSTVAWVNPHQQHPVHSLPPGFGIKFEDLDLENRMRIERVIQDYLTRHPHAR